jgi:mRNA-degrading endonuclease YafQ of YafQ-DinJ toxin-antitoxin module
MNRAFVWSSSFRKTYKKISKKHPDLASIIADTIILMQEDIFHPALNTHKLSGKLKGLYASSCGYDCRIIFTIERHGTEEEILLITFGSHDAVY